MNTEEQRAHAENALAVSLARFPHKETPKSEPKPRYLIEPLSDLLREYLALAVNPQFPLTAMENVVAARSMVDTAYTLGAIDHGPWLDYVALCNNVKLEVVQAETKPIA